MTAPPAISVLLPTRNGAATIETQLEALARQKTTGPWELVVADNSSSDETLAIVERYRDRIETLRVVDAPDGLGLPYACNVAARQAEGEALLVCNDDDVMSDGWLAAMGRALADHELVASRLEHEQLNEPWALEVRGRPQEDGLPRWGFGTHLPFGFGCALGFRRELHDAIGGYDETMVPAGEDADYCWRAQYEGAQLQFVPDAVMHYRARATLAELYRQSRNYGVGDVMLYKKHRPLGLPEIPDRARRGVRGWLGIGKRLLGASSKVGRGLLVWQLGRQIGLAQASARHRVLLL